MHLRNNTATPSRFDEEDFNFKRKKSTTPLYPKLLRAQVIPFNPGAHAAAFPSLPLMPELSMKSSSHDIGHDHKQNKSQAGILHTDTQPFTRDDRRSSSAESCNNVSAPSHILNSPHIVYNAKSTQDGGNEICPDCEKKRITWKALHLSVQIQIFNGLRMWSHSDAEIAAQLRLDHSELQEIRHYVCLRQIYHASTDDIYAYGVAASNLGPGVISADIMERLMDHLVFASRFETTDKEDVKAGQLFLKQSGLPPEVMLVSQGSAVNQTVQSSSSTCTKPYTSAAGTCQSCAKYRCVLNAIRSDPVEHIQKQLTSSRPPAAIQPATMTDSVANLTPSPLAARSRMITEKGLQISVLPEELLQDTFRDRSTGCINDMRTIRHLAALLTSTTTPKIHQNHNQRAFAAHFLGDTFPQETKLCLLKQNPKEMNNVDHWLVYGTLWTFTEHLIEYGPVPRTIDRSYNPRRMCFNIHNAYSFVLGTLITLHNHWVKHNAWEKGDYKVLGLHFNRAAETMMEKALRLRIPNASQIESEDSEMVDADGSKVSKGGMLSSEVSVPFADGEPGLGNVLWDNPVGSVEELPLRSIEFESSKALQDFSSVPGFSSHANIPADTAGSLGSHKCKANELNRQVTPQRLTRNAEPGLLEGSSPSPAVSTMFSDTTTDAPLINLNRPSFSPISEQDMGSLPYWVRILASRPRNSMASQDSTHCLPFSETRAFSQLQGGYLLQGIAEAAAKEESRFLESPEDSSPTALSSYLPNGHLSLGVEQKDNSNNGEGDAEGTDRSEGDRCLESGGFDSDFHKTTVTRQAVEAPATVNTEPRVMCDHEAQPDDHGIRPGTVTNIMNQNLDIPLLIHHPTTMLIQFHSPHGSLDKQPPILDKETDCSPASIVEVTQEIDQANESSPSLPSKKTDMVVGSPRAMPITAPTSSITKTKQSKVAGTQHIATTPKVPKLKSTIPTNKIGVTAKKASITTTTTKIVPTTRRTTTKGTPTSTPMARTPPNITKKSTPTPTTTTTTKKLQPPKPATRSSTKPVTPVAARTRMKTVPNTTTAAGTTTSSATTATTPATASTKPILFRTMSAPKKRRSDFGVKRGSYKRKRESAVGGDDGGNGNGDSGDAVTTVTADTATC